MKRVMFLVYFAMIMIFCWSPAESARVTITDTLRNADGTGVLLYNKKLYTRFSIDSIWQELTVTGIPFHNAGIRSVLSSGKILYVNAMTSQIDTSRLSYFYIPGVADQFIAPSGVYVWFGDTLRLDKMLSIYGGQSGLGIDGWGTDHSSVSWFGMTKSDIVGGVYPFNHGGNFIFRGNYSAVLKDICFYNGYNPTLMLRLRDTSSIDLYKKMRIKDTAKTTTTSALLCWNSADSTVKTIDPVDVTFSSDSVFRKHCYCTLYVNGTPVDYGEAEIYQYYRVVDICIPYLSGSASPGDLVKIHVGTTGSEIPEPLNNHVEISVRLDYAVATGRVIIESNDHILSLLPDTDWSSTAGITPTVLHYQNGFVP